MARHPSSDEPGAEKSTEPDGGQAPSIDIDIDIDPDRILPIVTPSTGRIDAVEYRAVQYPSEYGSGVGAWGHQIVYADLEHEERHYVRCWLSYELRWRLGDRSEGLRRIFERRTPYPQPKRASGPLTEAELQALEAVNSNYFP